MDERCVRAARGLLVYRHLLGTGSRDNFFKASRTSFDSFRVAASDIGGKVSDPGAKFFDVSNRGFKFGPGAGLVMSVSVGSGSLRAALVDANGEELYRHRSELDPDQLQAPPSVLLERIQSAARCVYEDAFRDEKLLVDGKLRMLGAAVAWPAPVDRKGYPKGSVLLDPAWRSGKTLNEMSAKYLGFDFDDVYAVNDTNAAAIAFVFDHTCAKAHLNKTDPEMTFVLRLAGGIGGSTVVIEPHDRGDQGDLETYDGADFGITPAFCRSIQLGGADLLSGEIGHVRVSSARLAQLRRRSRPHGLGPIEPGHCSCQAPGGASPDHLEAYASLRTVVSRVSDDPYSSEAIEHLIQNPDEKLNKRALEDAGVLIGDTLQTPVAWLNPRRIVLTGALALPVVAEKITEMIDGEHPIVTHAEVDVVPDDKNEFIRVRGAGLSMLRRRVHRRLPELLGGEKATRRERVEARTIPFTRDDLP